MAMQAGLTLVGNTTLWLAARRIYSEESKEDGSGRQKPLVVPSLALASSQSSSVVSELEKVFAISVLSAVALRFGPLYFDFPFHPSLPLALSIVLVPTGLNVAKWLVRSKKSSNSTTTTGQ